MAQHTVGSITGQWFMSDLIEGLQNMSEARLTGDSGTSAAAYFKAGTNWWKRPSGSACGRAPRRRPTARPPRR